MLSINTRLLPVAAISFGLLGQSAIAQTSRADASCQVALTSLVNEWNAISFAPPSKPAQTIVAGRNGYVTSGGQFNSMTELMRQARAECDRGDTASAMQDIAAVQDILGRDVHSKG
jgi:hypothetical protein